MRISDWSSDVCSSDLGPLAAGICGDPVADLRRFARQAGGQGDADPGIFEPGEPRPLGKRPAIGANIRAAEKGQREPRFAFGAAAAVKIYDVAAGRNVGIVVSHDDGIVSRHVRFQFLAMRSRSGVRSEGVGPGWEGHTSELQSLNRNSYAVLCLK